MFVLKQFLKVLHPPADAVDAHASGGLDLLAPALGEKTAFCNLLFNRCAP